MCYGKIYNFPVTVLRFFNTYGPGHSLNNPYTGIIAIFLNRLLNHQAPIVYENGQQTRDFISVHDVVNACIETMKNDKTNGQVLNIGTGIPTKIKDIAIKLSDITKIDIQPKIINKYRKGDIRHCYASIDKISKLLDWKPKINLYDGLKEVVEWAKKQEVENKFNIAQMKLEEKNLI
ncbi:MAG: GDP-mannose 4,6-dehydratase, partial [Planctomycetes bacterium]|nr:GDP-mannose 4,6-dehydratase [Planctomycetota bacterium]